MGVLFKEMAYEWFLFVCNGFIHMIPTCLQIGQTMKQSIHQMCNSDK